MEDNTSAIDKRARDLIKIGLKGKEIDVLIFYSVRSYKTYKMVLSRTLDNKEAFFSVIYEMISKDKDTINLHNITLDDVKVLKIEDLEKIAEHIINSSEFTDELKKIEEFDKSDCFRKMYLMNERMENYFKTSMLKIKSELISSRRNITNITQSMHIPLKNVHLQIKGVGLLSSQYLTNQSLKRDLINQSMKSLFELSDHMGKYASSINDTAKIAFKGYNSDIQRLKKTTSAFSDLNLGIKNQQQKQFELLRANLGSGLVDIQKPIQKIGLEIGATFNALKLHSIEFDKLIQNINSTGAVLKNSNIESIRSILLETSVGSRLLESQLKGIRESLRCVTKFNFGDKLISFESLNRGILKGIKPFFTDLNSIILSRNSFTGNIETKGLSMNSFGWWIISSLSITIINEIDKNKEHLSVDEVDYKICSYYSKNDFRELDMIVEGWEHLDYISSRLDILKESIAGHKLEKYKLTVPSSILLIEGVIRDFMLERYKIFGESFPPIFKRFKDKVEESSNFIATYVMVCIDMLYCRFSLINPDGVSDFNRHKIYHGLATKYGSEANSLKVILFLDEIFEIISSIRKMELISVN